jgi:hypothetical protein
LQSAIFMLFPFARFIHKATPRIILLVWVLALIYTLLPLTIMRSHSQADIRAMSQFCSMLPFFEADDFSSYLIELLITLTLYLLYVALCVATWCAVQRTNMSFVANKKSKLSRKHMLVKMFTVLFFNTCYYVSLMIGRAVTMMGFQPTQMIMAVFVSVMLSIPKLANPLIYNIKVIDKMRRKT